MRLGFVSEKKFQKNSKKPKSKTLRLNSERVVSFITKMPLETEFWKLKHLKCVFSFYNSSLKKKKSKN